MTINKAGDFAVTQRLFLVAAMLGAVAVPALSQGAAARFEVVEVHASPRRSYPFFYAVLLPQGRYVLRDATMVDLIATAYGMDKGNVQGGPSWLEMDHYDVIAKVPADTPKDTLRKMLRSMLEERFALKIGDGMRPMPAYVLSADKANLKMRQSDSSGVGRCEDKTPSVAVALVTISCRNMSMDDFAFAIHGMAGNYLNKPVVDATGLEGTWDFELKFSNRGDLAKAGADGISVFAAVEKQLGLKLELKTAPRPVTLVESVNEQPTANVAGMDKLMPPLPVAQFEVATIKPSKPGTRGNGNIGSGMVKFDAIPLKELIDLAWDLNEEDKDVIANAPKWLDEDRFDILAKVGGDSSGISIAGDAGGLPMDLYEVQRMLRALLVERFQIKAHMEDRPTTAYTLVAVNPKLRAADPGVRTQCKEGPGPDGKDPRIANPDWNRLVSCRNMTMAQICGELQNVASGYIFNTVADGTGIKGAYDFTLNFSSVDRLREVGVQTPGDSVADPSGALSIFDAVSRQLGLRLEKQKRALPVLVIEHIEEKPTDN